jgi:hypothetical protein
MGPGKAFSGPVGGGEEVRKAKWKLEAEKSRKKVKKSLEV